LKKRPTSQRGRRRRSTSRTPGTAVPRTEAVVGLPVAQPAHHGTAIPVAMPRESRQVICPGCGAAHQLLGRLPDSPLEPGLELGFSCKGCGKILSVDGEPATRLEADAEAAQTAGTDLVAVLERLARLREAGQLSEDEFKLAKAKLLEGGVA